MKVLLAFDSFKESMTSLEAAQAFQKGFCKAGGTHTFDITLISDGGEGFMESLIYARGKRLTRQVTGPLGEKVRAPLGVIEDTKRVAVVEMAHASGIEMVPPKKRNPMKTTSYGTGELINAALKEGVSEIIVGIGGSATVDGGVGMAAALGARFYTAKGKEITGPLTGKDLLSVASMNIDELNPLLRKTKITVACDVTNPLCGKKGAAVVFGPQKGASKAMVEKLEVALLNLAKVVKKATGVSVKNIPGSGAAGGVGAMLMALADAQLQSGIDIVLDSIGFKAKAKAADLIVTGEGRVDFQSLDGKAISGIAARSGKKPVLAIGGSVDDDHLDALYAAGITATLALLTRPIDLESAIAEGKKAMQRTGERAGRMMILGSKAPFK